MLPPGSPPSWPFTGSIWTHWYAGPPAATIAAVNLVEGHVGGDHPVVGRVRCCPGSPPARRRRGWPGCSRRPRPGGELVRRIGRVEVLDVVGRDGQLVGGLLGRRGRAAGRCPGRCRPWWPRRCVAAEGDQSTGPVVAPASTSPTFAGGYGPLTGRISSRPVGRLGVACGCTCHRAASLAAPASWSRRSRRTACWPGPTTRTSLTVTRMPSWASQNSRVERLGSTVVIDSMVTPAGERRERRCREPSSG